MIKLKKKASTSFDCDFEASKCGWTSDLTSNFEWERLQGKNNVSKWHPSIDFTTASAGYYIKSYLSDIFSLNHINELKRWLVHVD